MVPTAWANALYLQRLDAGSATDDVYIGSRCAYTLGYELFADLYDTLGDGPSARPSGASIWPGRTTHTMLSAPGSREASAT